VKALVYCVFFAEPHPAPSGVEGLDARAVSVVSRGGLGAVTSEVDAAPTPSLERVTTYERVVETFFKDRTVVPMRFGSVLESNDEVVRVLDERRALFEAQLHELAGCVEMGVRVAVPPHVGKPAPRRERPAPPAGPGRAWLEARAKSLEPDPRRDEDVSALVERYRLAFRGLYKRLEVGTPTQLKLVVNPSGKVALVPAGSGGVPDATAESQGPATVSLSFLVPREQEQAFRRAFERAGGEAGASHLSGPWPPYSFTSPRGTSR